ncbi:glutaminase A [Parahaliea maris]|uniref:Glutaminase n=1 Tax=Parahaliea maris TaxID=2716870 RepID=A0A5C9A017_9GAMM|nr:glutaminase A [Parahaliea maris]TXS92937.1 glutaminase A [Parahaliea maris]
MPEHSRTGEVTPGLWTRLSAGLLPTLFLALAVLPSSLALAGARDLQAVVDEAFTAYRGVDDGEVATYIPALAEADPDHFAVAIATVSGEVFSAGDSNRTFAIMSAAKPFTLALLLQQQGPDFVFEHIGVEPTGLPFNALSNIEDPPLAPLNPMVNAGAITAVSLLQAESAGQRWTLLQNWYSAFAGEPLELMDNVYRSVSEGGYRNRAVADLLQLHDRLGASPAETLEVYNRQSSVGVTAKQLAVMGATLASGGSNPLTGQRVLSPELIDEVLAVMMTSGFYDESGWWAYTTGLPAKSGVGGGVVAIVPGRMAIVGYSPRLSPAGNSVRGLLAVQHIARELRLNLFRTAP